MQNAQRCCHESAGPPRPRRKDAVEHFFEFSRPVLEFLRPAFAVAKRPFQVLQDLEILVVLQTSLVVAGGTRPRGTAQGLQRAAQ